MRMLLALAALMMTTPAYADVVTAPSYKDSSGQFRSSQGVIFLNTDGSAGGLPQPVTTTTTNGTVATANTFQNALAANANRKGCAIYNNSVNAELIYLGAPGSASAANGIPLPAGGAFNCGSFQGIVLTDQISIASAVVGSTFVVVSQ